MEGLIFAGVLIGNLAAVLIYHERARRIPPPLKDPLRFIKDLAVVADAVPPEAPPLRLTDWLSPNEIRSKKFYREPDQEPRSYASNTVIRSYGSTSYFQ